MAFALAVLFYRVFDDPKAIASTADANIEMYMEASLSAEVTQPFRKGSFAFALGADKDAPSLGNCSAPCHLSSTEGGQPAHNAASILLFEIAATPQPDDIPSTVNASGAVGTLLDDKHFLFLKAIQHGQIVE